MRIFRYLKWWWYRNKSFVSLDEDGLIGSAYRDGSCFLHSALAKMTEEDVIRIKNMVDNNPKAQKFLTTVKKNVHCYGNTETIRYLRAALAYEWEKCHNKIINDGFLNNEEFQEEFDAILGVKFNGNIPYSQYTFEILATLLNKEVVYFLADPYQNFEINYYHAYRNNNRDFISSASNSTSNNEFILKNGTKSRDYYEKVEKAKNSVSIILNGKHYFPFGNSNLTDKNKNFDNIIQLDSLVKEFLPKGCYDDFFNIFSELDNNKRQCVFNLLNDYEAKYILPVIYRTISKNPNNITRLNTNHSVENFLAYGKNIHVYFTKKIGLESLKESPALSKFINLLDPIEAEISASLIGNHGQDALSPLYEFSLQEIKTNLIACKILNFSPANLIERYNRDIAATKTAIRNKIQEDKNFENILKMPGASEILEQNPELIYKIYFSINEEVENLSDNYSQKRLNNLVKFVGFADKKNNAKNQNLNLIKQCLLWNKLNKSQNTELGKKVVESAERFRR